jgi:hypothetical protein
MTVYTQPIHRDFYETVVKQGMYSDVGKLRYHLATLLKAVSRLRIVTCSTWEADADC